MIGYPLRRVLLAIPMLFIMLTAIFVLVRLVPGDAASVILGEIVEIGPRAAIFGNPQHPYTKRLLAAVPIADPARRHEKRPVAEAGADGMERAARTTRR